MQYFVWYFNEGIDVGYFVYFSFVNVDEFVVINGFIFIVVVEMDYIFLVEKCYEIEEILF